MKVNLGGLIDNHELSVGDIVVYHGSGLAYLCVRSTDEEAYYLQSLSGEGKATGKRASLQKLVESISMSNVTIFSKKTYELKLKQIGAE